MACLTSNGIKSWCLLELPPAKHRNRITTNLSSTNAQKAPSDIWPKTKWYFSPVSAFLAAFEYIDDHPEVEIIPTSSRLQQPPGTLRVPHWLARLIPSPKLPHAQSASQNSKARTNTQRMMKRPLKLEDLVLQEVERSLKFHDVWSSDGPRSDDILKSSGLVMARMKDLSQRPMWCLMYLPDPNHHLRQPKPVGNARIDPSRISLDQVTVQDSWLLTPWSYSRFAANLQALAYICQHPGYHVARNIRRSPGWGSG